MSLFHAPRHDRMQSAPSTRIVGVCVLALIALALVGIAALRPGCAGLSEDVGAEPAYVSPYDWTALDRANGRFAYYEDGKLASRLGVDVSDHQGLVNWDEVAADGIDFAFVRVGYRGYTDGNLFSDERFSDNADGAQAAGLDVGAYFFSQAINEQEAREEAEFVLDQLAGRYLALPVAFDHEPVAEADGRANNLDDATVSACARAFCKRIEEGGYSTMVYGNAADIDRYENDIVSERPVWFAEYGVPAPTGQLDFSIWQYTNQGTVAGIGTSVDLNILFENAPQKVS